MNESNKNKMCRLCLRTDSFSSLSLFEEYKQSQVHELVCCIANIKIDMNDNLPHDACYGCINELEMALKFKTKCEDSDKFLRQSLKELEGIEKTPDLSIVKDEFDTFSPQFETAEVDNIKIEGDVQRCLDAEANQEDTQSYLDGETIQKDSRSDFKYLVPFKRFSEFQCEECEEIFKSKCKLRVHWKKMHKQKYFTCSKCKKSFKSESTYNKHIQMFKDSSNCLNLSDTSNFSIVGEGKDRQFCCTQCKYKTNRLLHLKAHLVVHTNSKPWQCHLCPKAYTQRGPLDLHISTIHSGCKKTPCEICGKPFFKGRNLQRHVKTHTIYTIECYICHTKVKSQQSLRYHMQRHGEKNYSCEHCAATFYTLSELCNHKRFKHYKKQEMFKCDICGYKTVRKCTMRQHQEKHNSNLLKYNCLVCGRMYETYFQLQRHSLLHNLNDTDVKCPLCFKKFANRRNVMRHLRAQHKVLYSHWTSSLETSWPPAVKREDGFELTDNQLNR